MTCEREFKSRLLLVSVVIDRFDPRPPYKLVSYSTTGGCRSIRSPLLNTRGFTLVEVMIAFVVMVIALLGFLGTASRAYQLTSNSRARDQARAILQSFAEDFERLRTVQQVGSPPTPQFVNFFQTSNSVSYDFVSWNGVTGTSASHLRVPLGGDPANPVIAEISRFVRDIDEATGADSTDTSVTAAGKMLVATFTATYTVNREPQTVSLTIARAL